MKPTTEQLHKAALLSVACNTIMLGVCDDLKETALYKQRRKQLINELTTDLERFVSTMYKDISEQEEQQFTNLVRVVEDTDTLVSSLTPHEIAGFQALIRAYRSGEVFTGTDRAVAGLVNVGRIKPMAKVIE